MKIAGVDLDKNEARFVLLSGTADDFQLVPIITTRLGLSDPKDQDEVRAFQVELQAFFDKYSVEVIGIRERLSKGRMKGGTITFKVEGLIQMCRQPVTLIPPATIRKLVSAASIDYTELPIAKYQHEAYGAAYTLIKTV